MILELLLWTSAQTAKALNTSVRHVQCLAKAGLLPCVFIGKRGLRFRPEDVREFVRTGGAPR